jgi:type I restriction enzyme S subunit
MGIPHVDGSYVRSIPLFVPPIFEQEQIVKFLDEKTTQIDNLISITENKIDLLKQKRTSLINEVVTKGLNKDVELNDSGVEWIGEIPKHWVVKKLKNICDLSISSVDKHIIENERKVFVCNYTDVYYNEFITKELELRVGSCSEVEYSNFLLNQDDVIITKDSESPNDIGVPSLVKDTLENVVCGYHLSIIKPRIESIKGGYLFRQLQTKRIRNYYEINSNGITRFGLGKYSVLETPIIVPPIEEQKIIIDYINIETLKIDELISIEKRRIDTLKEYRQSLISEVITGKIKVFE